LVVFGQNGAYVTTQLLSGPLIDRVGPRRISIGCDLVGAAVLGAVPVLYLVHELPLWLLVVMMAVVGAMDGPSNSAKGVFVPTVAASAGISLERTTGLLGAVERTATVVGPAIAGVMIAAVGNVWALWAAALLLATGALIVAMRLTDPAPRDRAPGAYLRGYRTEFAEGARFLRHDSLLSSIVVMFAATNMLDQAFTSVLLPVWARASGHGSTVVGLVISVFALTSIVAALTAAAIGDRLPRRPTYLIGYIIGGVPRFVAMALGLSLPAVVAVFAIGGLGSGFINPVLSAVTYHRVPAALLGRIRTLLDALGWIGIPFGGLVGAALIALVGLPVTLWITAGCYLGAIILPGLRQEWPQPAQGAPRVSTRS
jgi:MFS family permease